MSFFKKIFPVFGTGLGVLTPSVVTAKLATSTGSFSFSNLEEGVFEKPKGSVPTLTPVDPKKTDKSKGDKSKEKESGSVPSEKPEEKLEEKADQPLEQEEKIQDDQEDNSESSKELSQEPKTSPKKETATSKRKLNENLEKVIVDTKGVMKGFWKFLRGN